jgi:hypothetical protein
MVINLTKNKITPMSLFNRVKIIDMAIYHKPYNLVNIFYQNFTNLFLLYYGKALKRESGKVEKA